MRVKRYVVDTMPDAMHRIRTELGSDAVILNTKEIKTGGFLGLFGKKRIEVIAGIDNAQADHSTAQHAKPSAKPAHITASQPKPASDEMIFSPPPARSQAVQAYGRAASLTADPPKATSVPAQSPTTSADAASPHRSPERTRLEPPSDNAQLMEEIRSMKQLVAQLALDKQRESWAGTAMANLEQRLVDHEFAPELIRKTLAFVTEQTKGLEEPPDEATVQASARMYLRELANVGSIAELQPDSRVVHFVGPTGVGKTTTIAKLAAEQALKHKRKVGFITSDTYRIAAVEQLKTYANILNVPLEVVFSAHEVSRAFDQLKDRDVIFMDTAGRNFKNEMFVSEVNSLLRSAQKSETYLVLSMTTKYRDMKVITDNFSKYQIDKVLFTKMDETDSYGALFNLLHDFPFRLSYITTGQNVPDDIAKIDIDAILDKVMEER